MGKGFKKPVAKGSVSKNASDTGVKLGIIRWMNCIHKSIEEKRKKKKQ